MTVARVLDINLHTVLRAYQVLREEGLIELRRGRGAAVTAREPAGQARLQALAAELAGLARSLGMDRVELARLVESAYR